MWRETKILLIHDQAEQRKEFANILTFLDENHLACESAHWRTAVAELASSRGVLCVLLGGIYTAARLAEVIKELAEWDEFMPIILLDDEETPPLPADVKASVLTGSSHLRV